MRYALIAVIALLGPLSTYASAQTAEERAACQTDAKKLCSGVMPVGGRLLACLDKQKDKLSAACKKVVDSHSK